MKTITHLQSHLAQFALEWEMFQTNLQRKSKHILCLVIFFENPFVCEIMWDSTVESERPQMTVWHMRIACWILTATNTHSEYVILIAFHCKNGCMNTPHFYVIRIWHVLFILILVRSWIQCLKIPQIWGKRLISNVWSTRNFNAQFY